MSFSFILVKHPEVQPDFLRWLGTWNGLKVIWLERSRLGDGPTADYYFLI